MAVEALLVGYNGGVQKPAPVLVMVATTLPGRVGDGTPEFVLDLARHLERFRVVIVAPRVRGGARRETVDGVEIRRVPYSPRRWERLADDAILPALRSSPWLIWQVPTLLLSLAWGTLLAVKQTRPMVVNAHWTIPGGAIAWLVRRMTGVPYAVTVHGADAYALNSGLVQRVKRRVLRDAVVVLPVSADIAARIRDTEVEVGAFLPMGVDGDRLRRGLGQRCPEPGKLLFVGRLAEKKGVDVLLHALVSLPESHLTIVGDGPEREALESLSRTLGLDARVDFVGHAERFRVLEQLASAAALIVPSQRAADGDQDGTPVVMMEAMVCGVPVVASDLGGIGEQLVDGTTGLLVPPGDPKRLAAAIKTLLDSPELAARLAASARSYADANLDVGAIATRFDSIVRAAAS